MTVYVDNFRCAARVGTVRGRWSHLTADTPAELHGFAADLGLRRDWFQPRCTYLSCPAVDGVCRHFHYDVTDGKRAAAIAAGATVIDVRAFGALVSARRAAYREQA